MRRILCRWFGHRWNVFPLDTPLATLNHGGIYAVCTRCFHGQTLWFDKTN